MKLLKNNNEQQNLSYADALRGNSLKFSRRNLGGVGVVVVVLPNEENKQMDVACEIREKINLTKIGFGVLTMKAINKGGCFLGTAGKKECDKLTSELEKKMGESFHHLSTKTEKTTTYFV